MTDAEKLAAAERVANLEPDDADECRHDWHHYGTHTDGTMFYRCRICREEDTL